MHRGSESTDRESVNTGSDSSRCDHLVQEAFAPDALGRLLWKITRPAVCNTQPCRSHGRYTGEWYAKRLVASTRRATAKAETHASRLFP